MCKEVVRISSEFSVLLQEHSRGESAAYFLKGEPEYLCLMLSYYSILVRRSVRMPVFNWRC